MGIETVSNKVGKESQEKMHIYAHMGVQYYILLDPYFHIYTESLNIFELKEGRHERLDNEHRYMPEVGLGTMIWESLFEKEKAPWARRCTKEGNLLYTGGEKAFIERERAEQEKARADKLLEYLKSLGLSPEF